MLVRFRRPAWADLVLVVADAAFASTAHGSFQLFADAFTAALADSFNILPLGRRGAHTTQRLTMPANVCLVF